jgi:FADH2-dependent halogenase
MTPNRHDVLIIGGGPGGSSAASFLARAGKRVLLLEKEHFPRFHIGESLLPYNRPLFDELGVTRALEAAGFPTKRGAQFHLGDGSESVKFIFREGRFTREPEAIQVERAVFDHILLNHARQAGAEVREGWTVGNFKSAPDHVAVQASDDSGNSGSFSASFLIDASGRGNLTGNQEGLRVLHPRLKKLALFGHFTGVRRDEGPSGGDTVIVRLADKWFWLIPISADKTSVGCVMDQAEFAGAKQTPAGLFARLWRESPPLCERMTGAALIGSIQTTGDFSYHNTRFAGHRLLRVGDAAGFMDPIFSAGVYLAMTSGKLAAKAVSAALDESTDGAVRFAGYERRLRNAMSVYWEMVENFYTPQFMELLLAPREKFHLASAVNAILAGELEGGWKLRWRLRLFFLLVKFQKRWPLVPKQAALRATAHEI